MSVTRAAADLVLSSFPVVPRHAYVQEGWPVRYLILCLLMVSACAGQPVSEVGAGRYSVTATSAHGVVAARERAVKLANNYCRRNSQQAVVQSFDDERLGGVIGDPTTSLVFKCGTPNTTALSR